MIGTVILALADLVWIVLFCRITRIDEKEIRRGLLFPEIISAEEPVTIGRAPLYIFRSKTGPVPRRSVIFLASGDVDQTELLKYGVADIWVQSVMKRRFQRRYYNRTAKARERNEPERTVPGKILWVKDSPTRWQALKIYLSRRGDTHSAGDDPLC